MKTKKEFKVGDIVTVLYSVYKPNSVGSSGEIVSIDRDGDYLLKMENDIESYSYCNFNNYQSDKKDLLICPQMCIEYKK